MPGPEPRAAEPARLLGPARSPILRLAIPTLVAVAYLAAHVPSLAPTLEDIDSINFALGLHDFDPAAHQPHPPGYPVYIALGRVSHAVVHAASEPGAGLAADARALAALSALAGALALLLAWRLFAALTTPGRDPGPVALWGTLLLGATPLFWMTGLRPMSDMPGLAAALAAQVLLVTGRLHTGAFAAGLSVGVRSQTLWLTAPLVLLAMLERRGSDAWRARAAAVALAAAGALVWAVPLVIASGGLGAYLQALGSQAGEDFEFVDMLWANPTPRRLAFGLMHTFVMPWAWVPLAAAMLALAAAGAVVLAARDRRALVWLAAGFGPYALFHLVFQETVTVRYALPLIVPVAFLAARALTLAGPATNVVAVVPVVVSVLIAAPGGLAYGAHSHPAFRAVADLERRAAAAAPGLVASHYELRRPLRAAARGELPIAGGPPQREWLALVDHWVSGGPDPVWFLSNPRRTDLALIDPYARADVVRYRWAVERRPELSGTRPAAADWHRLRSPGWFLGEGWSLTAETAGLARATGRGPAHAPVLAWLRPREEPVHMLVGGSADRRGSSEAVSFELALNGAVVDQWSLPASGREFLRFIELPRGVPRAQAAYTQLTIAASGARPATHVAVRQFDAQPATRTLAGLGEGWYDSEYSRETGMQWRWASDRAVVRLRGPAEPVRLRVRGESPIRYLASPPVVTLSAAGRTLARFEPADDFAWELTVPADAFSEGTAEVVIETSRAYVPAERGVSDDARRLGLRVFALEIASAR